MNYKCNLCNRKNMDRIDKILHYENSHNAINARSYRECGKCGADLREGKYLDEITDYMCDVWKYCPNCNHLNYFLS